MKFFRLTLATALIASAGIAAAMPAVTIVGQGSFAAGGAVSSSEGTYDANHPQFAAPGQTLHGDHATVSWQEPQNARPLPLVFLHGAGQSSRTWDTTPDGRDGFRNIFLADRWKVFLVDQPRRGLSGRGTVAGNISATPDEAFWFGQFRMGLWPKHNEKTAFPTDDASMNQFFRQMTPNTAPYDAKVNAQALDAVLERSGDAVLVTHSQGCGIGWLVGLESDHVRGIAAWEPGSGFLFPEDEVPAPIENASPFGAMKASAIPMEAFMKFTKYPIVIYYGDHVPRSPSTHPHEDYWRAAAQMADAFVATVNRHGGDAKVVRLPDIGIQGNTHFMFAEKNNIEVANAFKAWLKEKRLD